MKEGSIVSERLGSILQCWLIGSFFCKPVYLIESEILLWKIIFQIKTLIRWMICCKFKIVWY